MKFCSECAHPVALSIPEGDNRLRYVCGNCDTIHYQNPKMVVGSITPVLASYLLPRKIEEKETIFVRAIEHVYRPALHWTLANARLTVTIGLLALAASGFMATRLGSEFLPALEEGNLWIRASMPPTISLEAGTTQVNRMRQLIKEYPAVRM